jgi:hypothetical protein
MKFRYKSLFLMCVLITIMIQVPSLQAQSPQYYSSPTNYVWNAFPEPRVSATFSSEERAKIWRSLARAQAVTRTSEVRKGVDRYVSLQTGEYDGTAPGTGSNVYIANWPVSERRLLYIDQYVRNDRTLGEALLGIISLRSNSDVHFRINLNAASLPSQTEERIAGTITHEILHNWGYKHDRYDRSKDDEHRRGNFVYEVGWCVARGGQDKPSGSLSLTSNDEFFVD